MKKILVIEDEPEMRRNLTTILRLEKFQPFAAENGRIGVELAKQELPDLILCDVMMPELDGVAGIAGGRSHGGHPVHFPDSQGRARRLARRYESGADDYLTKPVPKADLLKASPPDCSAPRRPPHENSSRTFLHMNHC
ncbi:MAG: response regulator [Limisphaerales bacterium]